MKLADLPQAIELSEQLARLDQWPIADAMLYVGESEMVLGADELAAFIQWRQGNLHAALRALGIDSGGDAPPHVAPAAEPIDDFHDITPDKPRAERNRAEPQSGGSATAIPLTRAEAEKQAVRSVMGAAYTDWQNGAYDDPGAPNPAAAGDAKFAELRERRAGLIAQAVDDILRGQVVTPCAECGAPATTTIAGRAWCDSHAKTAPRERGGWLKKVIG